MARRKIAIVRGSDNVFADLGYADAVERQNKTRLAMAANAALAARKLRQTDAARILGVGQPKVSALANYRLDQFSVETLMGFLAALGHDVEIMIRPRRARAGAVSVIEVR